MVLDGQPDRGTFRLEDIGGERRDANASSANLRNDEAESKVS